MINRQRKRESGSAILLVAWLLGIIGVIAIYLTYRAEVEWAAVTALENRNLMQQLAEQQLQERLALLAADDTPGDGSGDAWYGGNGRITLEKNGCRIILIIQDEGAKPNLNCLNAAGLKELADSKIDIAPIIDWRDTDNEPVADGGAETSYYQNLNPPYQARNGFFSSLEELKELKNGPSLYQMIAPEVTVFGPIDPNLLDEEGMRSLLQSVGFEKNRADMIAVDFQTKHRTRRFTTLTDLESLNGLDILNLKRLQPYLQFSAVCNPNFMSLKGLEALLINFGLDKGKAKTLIREREPFTDLSRISSLLGLPAGTTGQPLAATDYFTVVSTLFRIRIWVFKGDNEYYLETVQQRVPASRSGQAGRGWLVEPLTWKVLRNQETPSVPTDAPETDLTQSESTMTP